MAKREIGHTKCKKCGALFFSPCYEGEDNYMVNFCCATHHDLWWKEENRRREAALPPWKRKKEAKKQRYEEEEEEYDPKGGYSD